MNDFKDIVVTDNGPIRTVKLNRPAQRNAMTPAMQMELIAALEDSATSGCRVLTLMGEGTVFCAGLDLSSLQNMQGQSAAEHRADTEQIARLFLTLYEMPIPTIAAVHGPAIAGGAGLAMICDFTLATPAAKFGFTEVRIGFVPALVSAFLALQVGHKRSMDLLLTGRIFGAVEALGLGLVNEIVAPEELNGRVKELAETLITNSPQAQRATKRLIAAQNKAWLDAAIVKAVEAGIEARTTADFRSEERR